MFINISSDRIFAVQGEDRHELPYGELEKNLPQFLYESEGLGSHGAEGDMTPHQRGGVVVLNGPGSFTNLRIATLALNTYNTLHNFAVPFVSVDKITWYKMLYKQGIVTRYCVMYIGQKKYVWVVDLETVQVGKKETGEVWVIGDTGNEIGKYDGSGCVKIHIDHLVEQVSQYENAWFVDELVAEGKEILDKCLGSYIMHHVTNTDVQLFLQESDQFLQEKMLIPNYMIEANVG